MFSNDIQQANVTWVGDLLSSSRKRGFINDEESRVLQMVNEGILCGFIGLFGMMTNVINMIVFYKQGLHNTINITLFSMSISDFAAVTTMMWFGICKIPLVQNSNIGIMPLEFSYLTGAWPHGIFTRITCFHTAYATAERCICIALPLKCKQIITPRRTATLLCTFYIVNFMPMIPQYGSAYIDWKFYPDRNRTLLGIIFRNNRACMEGVSFLMHAFLGLFSFAAVIVFTTIFVIKLSQRTKWRKKSASEIDTEDGISGRDRKTIKMILLIATVLIICFTPGILSGVVIFIEPEFCATGRYSNEFRVAWSFANVFQILNSSINIIFYLKMSSRYRTTLIKLLTGKNIETS